MKKAEKKNRGGRPKVDDPSRSRSLAIPESIWLRIEQKADESGRSKSELVSLILGRSGMLKK